MKRLLCLWLGLCCLICGCGQIPAEPTGLQVVATIFPAYDFARQIGGELAQVTMLLSPGGEAHGFEPSLQDVAAVAACDVLIYNGGESDRFVEQLLENCDVSQKTVIRLMDYAELLVPGETHHHAHHHHEVYQADEHVWTAPENTLRLAEVIAQSMMNQDPDNQPSYRSQMQKLIQQLQELSQKYAKALSEKTGTLVVADRFPFLYLTHAYGISYQAAFSGCSSNTEPDLATVYQLVTAAKTVNHPMILHTEFSDGLLAKRVAEASHGEVAMLHSCHNVSKEDFSKGVTYVNLMEQNLLVLKEALQG